MSLDEVTCTRCGANVTAEVKRAAQSTLDNWYAGYNPMSMQYAPPEPPSLDEVVAQQGRAYVCLTCQAAPPPPPPPRRRKRGR